MRPFLAPLAAALVCILFFPTARANEPGTTFVDPDAPEVASIRQAAEAATAAVGARLFSALSTAMGSGGPESAVEVCHTLALPLTEEATASQSRVVSVKRTSLRVRNPANAPDEDEVSALNVVAHAIDRGEPVPGLLIQKLSHADHLTEWRVYQPITTKAACLACHGAPASQPAGLRAKLQALYPEDAAIDYKEGEWRGLFRVTVDPAPASPGGE